LSVDGDEPASSVATQIGLPEVSARSILRGSGPRFALDAGAPVLVFYAGWKLSGLVVGVVAATIVGLGAYAWERHRERPGVMARVALAFVLVQAAVGLGAGSAKVYLAQPVLLNGVLGLAFLVSVLAGRPLAGAFAQEMYPFPPQVAESDTFRRVFTGVSLAWAVYLLARSSLRLFTLSMSVDAFVAVNVATGFPVSAALMSWSVWYGVRGFRRSEEWGWALAEESLG
jgi:intracellular septation protein A